VKPTAGFTFNKAIVSPYFGLSGISFSLVCLGGRDAPAAAPVAAPAPRRPRVFAARPFSLSFVFDDSYLG
jgi:hypothetical protein